MNRWRRLTRWTLVFRFGVALTVMFVAARTFADDSDPSSTVLDAAAILAARAQAGVNTLYLIVTINGEPTNAIVSFEQQAGQLFIQRKDLAGLGIDTPLAGDALVNLDTLAGLHYRFDPSQQSIDLQVPDAMRTPFALGRRPRAPLVARTGTGLVLNYDAYAQHSSGSTGDNTFELSSEQRLFGAAGVLTNTGITLVQSDYARYVRETSNYQFDDPGHLLTFVAGDTISSALGWTRPVRLGGLQMRRDFSLQPDLITFPIPQLSGSAAMPSNVDLYINSIHQLSSQVPSGPFVINGAASITGGGIATVITRDAFGRTVSSTLPIYVDSRLLSSGLSSYSLEAGALRYQYAQSSFDYEGHAATSGTYRYGFNDYLTFESHAEATRQFGNAGFGVLLRLGDWGVLNAGLANSAGTGTQGEQLAIGYQLILPGVSLTAQATHTLHDFTDLAAISGTPAPRLWDQFTAAVPMPHEQTVGSSFVHVQDAVVGRSSIGALWYSLRVNHRVSTFFNVSNDFQQHRSWTLWLGVSLDLGNRVNAFSNAGATDGRALYGGMISRGADYGGGWEWAAQSLRSNDVDSTSGRLGYLGQYGEAIATGTMSDRQAGVSVEGVGGLLLMDGTLEASRRIGAGFALVSTDGVSGVPVLHENRVIGATDDSGHLLVPDLNPYDHNSLAIDSMGLPAEAKVPVDHMDIAPRGSSGVLAEFPIGRYMAASITLVDAQGQFLPAGTRVHHAESGHDLIVGYDGQVFVEEIRTQNHLQAQGASFACMAEFDFKLAADKNAALANLGRVVCRPGAGKSP